MRVRTGRQATMIAVFFLFLILVVIVDATLILNVWEPVPEGQIEVPMEEV
jgi:hypothetical protein